MNNTTSTPVVESLTDKVSVVKPEVDSSTFGEFGTGVLPALATEFYGDMQRELCITKVKADKIARSFMSDFGRVMHDNPEVSYKVGKAKKDNSCNLGFACKSIKTYGVTNSLKVARLCTQLWALRKEKLIANTDWREILPADGENSLFDYVDKI